jgi:zinc transporter 1/2/3
VKTQLMHSEGSALCSLALSDEDRSDEKKLLDKAELRNLKLIVIIFEFGVAVHSVIVGLDFGVSTGQTAVTLFAALIFHQFFEGVALGTTISEADFAWWLVMLMVISFALETPVGTAIGMGISRAYNPNSVASLVIRGVLDGLSAGITLNTELHKQQLVWVVLTIAFVWAGAIGMSIIGAWI